MRQVWTRSVLIQKETESSRAWWIFTETQEGQREAYNHMFSQKKSKSKICIVERNVRNHLNLTYTKQGEKTEVQRGTATCLGFTLVSG